MKLLMRRVFLLAWMLGVQAAWPVVMKPLSLDELAGRAELVLRGTVVGKSCQRDPAGRIYTKVELKVAEVWKGQAPIGTFTIVQGGGILGEERVVIAGQAEYQLNDEVVVFLVRNDRGEGVTLGLAQGKFHVWKDAASGVSFVQNPFHGRGQSKVAGIPGPGLLTLAALKSHVQGAKP